MKQHFFYPLLFALTVSIGFNLFYKWRIDNFPKINQPVQYYPVPMDGPIPVMNPIPRQKEIKDIPTQEEDAPLFPSAVKTTPSTSPVVCAADLDFILKGKLKGKGKTFLDAANRWQIDPILLVAISAHETGQGTSDKVYKLNNPGGLMIGGKTYMSFESIDKGIDNMAERIRKNYFDCGLKTAKAMQPKYCPVGAKNDPKNLNEHWLTGVEKFYTMIKNNKLPQYASSK